MSWQDHPARRRPRAVVFAVLYVAAASLALHLGFRTPWLTLLGRLGLVAAAADFWFPTAYALDANGASVRSLLGARQLAWSAVRCAARVEQQGQCGVMLSPVGEPGLAQRMRSLWLPVAVEGEPSLDTLVGWVERHALARRVPGVAHG
ncbi:MAG: hypothetical protein HZB16_03760 [Armatimonadetes bacterium]|nr:hypothetical protein [Armatimonadota bacterium]